MIARLLMVCLLIAAVANSLYAQNESDALRHSMTAPTGTARSLAMGGAFSAAGADISSATLNPAGLALYRRSEFVITPSFKLVNSNASYLDGTGSGSNQNLGVANWGIVFHNPVYYDNGRNLVQPEKGLMSFTFAFGYNQIENYHSEISASGYNEYSSITDMFTERANGTDASQLNVNSFAGLAFNSFAIDTLVGRGGSFYYPAVNEGRVQQSVSIVDEGKNNEWFFSIAGNLDDFLYMGLTIGIQSLRYERQLLFEEQDINNLHQFYQPNPDDPNFPLEFPFNSLVFSDNFTTRGLGINGKLGIIIRPVDQFRAGISVQTPTYFGLTDEYSTSIVHNYETDQGAVDTEQNSDPGQFEYNLSTPFRATFGAMYLLGKKGFITADVEYTDYSTARLSTNNVDISSPNYYAFTDENNNIGEFFKSAVNVRLGAEARVNIIRIRAGAGLFGRALTDAALEYVEYPEPTLGTLNNPERRIFTFGLGLRQPNYHLDVTFVNQQQNEKINPYNIANPDIFVPTIVNTRTVNSVVMSLGFKL